MKFKVLPEAVRGCFSLILYILNTVFWCIPLFILAATKAVIPSKAWARKCNRILNAIAENWIWVNNQNQKFVGNTGWDIQGVEALEKSKWYLVLANHQSWVDILVLQRIFHRKIPFLKFFIKKELLWLPISLWFWLLTQIQFSATPFSIRLHLRIQDFKGTAAFAAANTNSGMHQNTVFKTYKIRDKHPRTVPANA